MWEYDTITSNELYHFGVKGMKWGVRKDRTNSNGSNDSKSVKKKKVTRGVLAATITATTITAGALYAKKHPDKIGLAIQKVKDVKIKDLSDKAIKAGKEYTKKSLKNFTSGLKEGIQEGLKEAPKKAAKTVIIGSTIVGTKKMLDSTIGKEESAKIFQANNNKKIDKFWKVNGEDKDDRDEDD